MDAPDFNNIKLAPFHVNTHELSVISVQKEKHFFTGNFSPHLALLNIMRLGITGLLYNQNSAT